MLIGGIFTIEQVVALVVAVIVIGIIVKFMKGTLKFVLTVGVAVVALAYFGVVSPTQIQDAAKVVQEKGVDAYKSFTTMTKNVRLNGKDVQLNLEGEWVSLSDVKSFKESKDSMKVYVEGGKSYNVEDEWIIQMLLELKR